MDSVQMQEEMERYFSSRWPVTVKRDRYGCSLFSGRRKLPVARLRLTDRENMVEVLWWSHRERWESIGDFDGIFMPFDEALEYIAEDRPGCFFFSPL